MYYSVLYERQSLCFIFFANKCLFVVEPQYKKKPQTAFLKKKLKRNIFITTAWHHYSKFQKININNITTTFLLGYVVMRNFLLKHKMFNKNEIALFVNFILEPFLCFINKKKLHVFFSLENECKRKCGIKVNAKFIIDKL